MELNEGLKIAGLVIGALVSLGGIFAGVGYGYGKFREGRTKQSLDGIKADEAQEKLLNGRIDSLQKMMEQKEKEALERDKVSQKTIMELQRQIGQLEGQLTEKDKTILALQGRSPEYEKVFMDMTKTMTDIHQFMQRTDGSLTAMLSIFSKKEQGSGKKKKLVIA